MPHSCKSKEIKYEWKLLRDVQCWLVSLFHTSHKGQSRDGIQLSWTVVLYCTFCHWPLVRPVLYLPVGSWWQCKFSRGHSRHLWGYCRLVSCAQKPSLGRAFRVRCHMASVTRFLHQPQRACHEYMLGKYVQNHVVQRWLGNGRCIRWRIYFIVILPCKVKAMDHVLRSHINLAPGYPQQKLREVNCQCPFIIANS